MNKTYQIKKLIEYSAVKPGDVYNFHLNAENEWEDVSAEVLARIVEIGDVGFDVDILHVRYVYDKKLDKDVTEEYKKDLVFNVRGFVAFDTILDFELPSYMERILYA